jgi:hypothetical protein
MEKREALKGVDLRKLYTFLKDKDEKKVLGNLYRTVTDEGHIIWVCIDHYRVKYQENSTMELQRVLDSVGGSFNENIGKVKVMLWSRMLAVAFYSALEKARSVCELDIDLHWGCTTSDLVALGDALKKSRISNVRLDLRRLWTGVTGGVLPTFTWHDAIFSIRDLPNMKVFHILFSSELIKFLELSHKESTHPCKMTCELGGIGGKEFWMVAEALKTNSTLTTLGLMESSIGSDGAKALSDALKIKPTLTTLNLERSLIGSGGARALAEALKINSTLTTLNLYSNLIGDEGTKALVEALEFNSTLTTLDLWSNSIGYDGAKALAKALKTNSTLTTLNLDNNSIGYDGAIALAEALKLNTTLTTLKLYNNKIKSDGAKALAEALKANSTLTTLDLINNSIGDNGTKALTEALKINLTLTTLELFNNSIGSDGAKALAEAL